MRRRGAFAPSLSSGRGDRRCRGAARTGGLAGVRHAQDFGSTDRRSPDLQGRRSRFRGGCDRPAEKNHLCMERWRALSGRRDGGQGEGLFRPQRPRRRLVNYAGSTDQLLEAIATGKADAGVGMALRWLKPLEQGFDVKSSPAPMAAACGCWRRRPRNQRAWRT